jgi:single-stranded-DNA-specific exonuclease
VAIGSIADVAPLRGDNRILVRAGLDAVRKAERPGLRALLDLIGVDRRYPVLASDIAFRVAPRLNAPGRLGAPDVALSLLREKDSHKAQLLAAEVESQCQTRRTHQATILEEAEAQVEELGLLDAPALVLGKQGWNPGIVGIVAGRLAEKYARPALVVGFEDEIGRGSLRGPAGFPLFDALSSCSAHLCKFGGHQAAAGLEVLHARFLDFRAAFEAACRQHKPTSVPSSVAPLPVHPDDEWSAILSDLYLLEPCGEKNPAPELELDCEIERSTTVRGGHLKLELRCPSGRRLGAFGPNMGNSSTPLEGPAKVIGRLRPDTYRGGEAVELLLTRVDCARL